MINETTVPVRANAEPPFECQKGDLYSIPITDFYSAISVTQTAEQIKTHRHNRSPQVMTMRLQELVPLCRFNAFRIDSVTDNETTGSVPLLASTMNQNGTHQSSVFYLMSDYIAGVAVYAGLPGTYIVGIHDRSSSQPVQMWLKSNKVTHLRPGTGLIRGQARIPTTEVGVMKEKLIRKGRCDIKTHVDIFQEEELIAIAEPVIGVYLDNPKLQNRKMDFFQRENSKLSARLIAALHPDEISQEIAGAQGQALAVRFSDVTPQLLGCVEARREHLKHFLDSSGFLYSQVVELGIGLDTQPFQYASKTQKWFGLDLRHLCSYRQAQFSQTGGDASYLTLVPADLMSSGWGEKLIQKGFDPSKPTLFIIEGFIHYCHEEQAQVVFEELGGISGHSESRVWVDHVTPNFYRSPLPEISAFLSNISRLGEPFVLGFTRAEALTSKWRTEHQRSSTEVLGALRADHPVYDHHYMSILAPITSSTPG